MIVQKSHKTISDFFGGETIIHATYKVVENNNYWYNLYNMSIQIKYYFPENKIERR